MKTITLTAITSILLLLPQKIQQPERVHSTVEIAAIRSESSSDAPQIAGITSQDHFLRVIERKENWIKVRIDGWVRDTQLSGLSDLETEEAYCTIIELKDVKVADALLADKGVFGEIKNRGNRTLTKVEITIYFLDALGQPIYEKTYHPVNVSSFNFMGDTSSPLKPNYGRTFGVRADDVPSDWAQRVRVEVTEVEFEK